MVLLNQDNCIKRISTVKTEKGEIPMIVLDYRDRRPLYEQVTERLEELMFQEILTEIQSFPQSAALQRSFPSIPIPSRERMQNWSKEAIFILLRERAASWRKGAG